MKRRTNLLILAGLIFIMLHCTQSQTKEVVKDEYAALETMGYYQRFSQKLYFAGINENWKLADFYINELKEVTEELVKKDVIHDSYNLSNLSEAMLLPKIEKVGEAISEKNQVLFLENYKLMISSCNLCHQATRHPFLKMTVPDDSSIWNQDFMP